MIEDNWKWNNIPFWGIKVGKTKMPLFAWGEELNETDLAYSRMM